MKNDTKSIEDIQVIRKIMEESSRFLSLSGLSGVFAGITAIAGALFAYIVILRNGSVRYEDYLGVLSAQDALVIRKQLLADAVAVLVISGVFAFYFSVRKARKDGKNFLTPISRRLLVNLFIPLLAGGVLAISLLIQNYIQLIIPCFLIFYGLALVNAGKFTFGEIHWLGVLEVLTGLVCLLLPQWSVFIWAFGFGIIHIGYGLFMHLRYKG